jgi:hypothetical protein
VKVVDEIRADAENEEQASDPEIDAERMLLALRVRSRLHFDVSVMTVCMRHLLSSRSDATATRDRRTRK